MCSSSANAREIAGRRLFSSLLFPESLASGPSPRRLRNRAMFLTFRVELVRCSRSAYQRALERSSRSFLVAHCRPELQFGSAMQPGLTRSTCTSESLCIEIVSPRSLRGFLLPEYSSADFQLGPGTVRPPSETRKVIPVVRVVVVARGFPRHLRHTCRPPHLYQRLSDMILQVQLFAALVFLPLPDVQHEEALDKRHIDWTTAPAYTR